MKQKYLYSHYSVMQGANGGKGGSTRVNRLCRILLVVVSLAAAVSICFAVRGENYRRETYTAFINVIRAECNSAIVQTNSLSRTAGANSSAILGRIRSHIHTMDTINQLNADLEGNHQYMISTGLFTQLYDILDNYANRLVTGMVTGELQTQLQTTLDTLAAEASQLK